MLSRQQMEIETLNRQIQERYSMPYDKNWCPEFDRLVRFTWRKVHSIYHQGNHFLNQGQYCLAISCYDNVLTKEWWRNQLPHAFEYFQEALIAQLSKINL